MSTINVVKWGLHLLEVEITTRCDLNCGHCYNRNNKSQDMPIAEVIKLIELAEDNNVLRFIISGGEAVLHPDFANLAAYLIEKKPSLKMVIQSNGLIGKHNVELLKGFDIVHLSFELDNSKIRKSSVEYIVDTAHRFIDNGIYTYLFSTIHPGNIDRIDSMVEIANKNNLDIGFNICIPGHRKNLQLLVEQKMYVMEKLYMLYLDNRILRFTSPFVSILKGQIEQEFTRIKGGCTAGVAACVVLANGDVIPCPFFRVKAGNIYEEQLEKIWLNSELFIALRQRSLFNDPCGSCQYLAHCGGCRARAYEETGVFNGFDPDCPNSLIKRPD
ncbi:radical SAM protein [Candidatus Falkowbacteria bacterium]|nr:radical SAM protein [Candidatus Falkowbacteria bacterium]